TFPTFSSSPHPSESPCRKSRMIARCGHKKRETLPLGSRVSLMLIKADYLPFFAYFFLNRSTRPSVATIFCVPVKNGWQLEQISTLISPTVDRVLQLLPQAQCTVASRYNG